MESVRAQGNLSDRPYNQHVTNPLLSTAGLRAIVRFAIFPPQLMEKWWLLRESEVLTI